MFGKKKVLVVDDDLACSDVLKIALEQAGYNVLIGYDGSSAIQKAYDLKPDLILLDIIMPDMDGFKVLDTLRLNKRTSKIPVIMCSGRNDLDSTMKAAEKGAKGFLLKPYEPQKVIEKVNSILK